MSERPFRMLTAMGINCPPLSESLLNPCPLCYRSRRNGIWARRPSWAPSISLTTWMLLARPSCDPLPRWCWTARSTSQNCESPVCQRPARVWAECPYKAFHKQSTFVSGLGPADMLLIANLSICLLPTSCLDMQASLFQRHYGPTEAYDAQ